MFARTRTALLAPLLLLALAGCRGTLLFEESGPASSEHPTLRTSPHWPCTSRFWSALPRPTAVRCAESADVLRTDYFFDQLSVGTGVTGAQGIARDVRLASYQSSAIGSPAVIRVYYQGHDSEVLSYLRRVAARAQTPPALALDALADTDLRGHLDQLVVLHGVLERHKDGLFMPGRDFEIEIRGATHNLIPADQTSAEVRITGVLSFLAEPHDYTSPNDSRQPGEALYQDRDTGRRKAQYQLRVAP